MELLKVIDVTQPLPYNDMAVPFHFNLRYIFVIIDEAWHKYCVYRKTRQISSIRSFPFCFLSNFFFMKKCFVIFEVIKIFSLFIYIHFSKRKTQITLNFSSAWVFFYYFASVKEKTGDEIKIDFSDERTHNWHKNMILIVDTLLSSAFVLYTAYNIFKDFALNYRSFTQL